MKKGTKKTSGKEFDMKYIKKYIKLPAEKKLEWLEESNRFLRRITPKRAKQLNEELKKIGI